MIAATLVSKDSTDTPVVVIGLCDEDFAQLKRLGFAPLPAEVVRTPPNAEVHLIYAPTNQQLIRTLQAMGAGIPSEAELYASRADQQNPENN